MMTSIERHVGSFGLRSGERPSLDGRKVPLLVDQVTRSRLCGLALASVASGDLVIDDDQRSALERAQISAAAIELELDALMLQALTELGNEGIVVLKGAAHAHTEYIDPSWRDYGDLDLFVAPNRVDEVLASLARRGFQRAFAEFAPAWDREFGKSITLQDGRLEVDVHRNLSQGLGLGIRPADVLQRRSTVAIATVDVPVLDADARFVHAAVHAFGGSATAPANGLVDIARMADDPGRVAAALDLARQWRVARTFSRAVLVAAAELTAPATSTGLVDTEPWSPTERWRTRILERPDRAFRHDVAAGLLSLQSNRDRTRYVRRLASARARHRR